MKERPILFQGAMVRALLADTKTQTRRVVKPQPWASCCIEEGMEGEPPFVYSALGGDGPGHDVHETRSPCRCPYGAPGDRLWVREAWQYSDWTEDGYPFIRYRADDAEVLQERIPSDEWGERLQNIWIDLSSPENYSIDGRAADRRWRPGIHMPRWASRITLEVTGVRVERLQDISEADAIAEGIHKPVGSQFWHSNDLAHLWDGGGGLPGDTPQRAYRSLWNSINLPPSPVQERIAGKLVTVAYVSYPWSMEDFEHAYPGVAASGLYRGKPLTVTPDPWLWVISFRRNT